MHALAVAREPTADRHDKILLVTHEPHKLITSTTPLRTDVGYLQSAQGNISSRDYLPYVYSAADAADLI